MKSVIAFIALLVTVSAFEYQEEFDAWKRTFGKSYGSDMEELKRQILWESNRNFVENHNKHSDKFGFTVEMNQFADLETSEFKEIYNGLTPRDSSYKSVNLHLNTTEPNVATVDWRKKGAVTEIKNQGHCGSCWSFSATGSLEGQYFLKTGKLVSLSEQQLMDCSEKFGDHGCKGGLMDNAFRYLATVAGDESEREYPYKAEDGFCRYEASEAVAGLRSHTDIPRGSESGLMNAVESVGPISIAIDAGHKSFQLYKRGVYYEPECSSTKLDHGVLAVGYGTEMEEAYWLVKNSWGDIWGMDGYVMMSRNRDNNCGIATQASYPTGVHAAEN